MKNIHILPTPKPSRLIKNNRGYALITDEFTQSDLDYIEAKFQNICITNDEEIKEGDWFSNKNGQISICVKALEEWLKTNKSEIKKIILTTDPDLIKDGVQAINNEFLKWFVKNSSCESVETVIEKMFPMYESFPESINKPPFYGNLEYKIIIPKEEPKQETLETDKTNWKAVYEDSLSMQKCSNAGYESKIQELKQEIERMYSEITDDCIDDWLDYRIDTNNKISFIEWFKQFKKK